MNIQICLFFKIRFAHVTFAFLCIAFQVNWLVCETLFCDKVLNIDNFDAQFGWNSIDCELHSYKGDDVVKCFDLLSQSLHLEDRPLHFAFVGDSRMRLVFHSFWPVINYLRHFNKFKIFCVTRQYQLL